MVDEFTVGTPNVFGAFITLDPVIIQTAIVQNGFYIISDSTSLEFSLFVNNVAVTTSVSITTDASVGSLRLFTDAFTSTTVVSASSFPNDLVYL